MEMEIPTFDEIFKQIHKNLHHCGIGQPMLRFKFSVPLSLLLIVLLEELSYFVSKISSDNFLKLITLTPYLGAGVLSIVKLLCIVLKRKKIFQLMASLEELYQDIRNDPRKKAIVARNIVVVKSFTKHYFTINWILICIHNFCPLVVTIFIYVTEGYVKWVIPYAVLLPFSTQHWCGWLVVYIHSITCGFICILYYTTVDALYYNLTCIICCQFRILSDEIKNLNPSNTCKLNQLVQRHQRILDLSKDLEEIFTGINLANILFGSIDICVIGFNTMIADWIHFPGYLLFLLCKFLQIFIMSVFGENLLQESGKVGDAAFMCEWYNMEYRFKKCLLIIIIRSQKAQRLTAYKFSTICHNSFTKIISTSWSYFTILKTVYKPSDITAQE